jgi:hypothetical protein
MQPFSYKTSVRLSPAILPKAKAGEVLLCNSFGIEGPGKGINLGTCKRAFQIIVWILMRCWPLACVAVLSCLLLYWVYGGLLACLLLCFATTGESSIKKTTTYFCNCMNYVYYTTFCDFRDFISYRGQPTLSPWNASTFKSFCTWSFIFWAPIWKCLCTKCRWDITSSLFHSSAWWPGDRSTNGTLLAWQCRKYGSQVLNWTLFVWDNLYKHNKIG